MRIRYFVSAVFIIAQIQLFAFTRTWKGTTDALWSTSSNWVEGIAPTTGDDIVFNQNTSRPATNNDLVGKVYKSIKITGATVPNISIAGNSFGLSGGATAIVNSASNGRSLTISAAVSFSTAAPTITLTTSASNQIIITGAIDNGGYLITVSNIASSLVSLLGEMSGMGGLSKNGLGTLLVGGNNTYSGTTTVAVGILKLGSPTALGVAVFSSVAAPTVVNANAVLDLNGQTYANTERITINTTASGALINSSTTAATFIGELWLASDSYINASVGDILLPDNGYNIAGPDALVDAPNLTLGGAANGLIGGVIATNTGGITKNGTGTWTIARHTAYTGATLINAGTLMLKSANNRSASYTIATGSVLEYNTTGFGNSNSFRSTVFSGSGTLRKTGPDVITWLSSGTEYALSATARIDIQAGSFVCDPNMVWTNNLADLSVAAGAVLNLGATSVVRVDELSGAGNIVVGSTSGVGRLIMGVNNGSAAFSGILSNYNATNTGTIEKIGTGTQTLSGANTYTGQTIITAGELKLGASEVIPNISAVTVTGTLNLNSFSETVGSITGTGYIDNKTGGGNPIFKFGVNNSTTAFAGVMKNTTGTMNVTKTGTGKIYLDGDNTYYGQTYVEDGFVEIRNGSIDSQ